jgi:hypothetical protein
MRYWLLAGVSALSAFAIFALAGTTLARLAGGLLAGRLDTASAARRARVLFGLRILSGATAGIAAFAVALPIFLWFEEPDTVEPVNGTLALAAAAGGFLILRGLWRAATAWYATARVVRDWERRGRRIDGLAARMPVYAIDEAFPTVAVAGIFRPRLFVAERVLTEFTTGEVAAMIAHECAHVSAKDNVKRLLARACPDVFGTPRQLDREWTAAAEEAADARAAGHDPSARLDLAQALVRVARLAAPRAPELVSAFYLGGSIDRRVRRLVDPPVVLAASRWSRVLMPAAFVLLVTAVVLGAPWLHAAMEQAVQLLP